MHTRLFGNGATELFFSMWLSSTDDDFQFSQELLNSYMMTLELLDSYTELPIESLSFSKCVLVNSLLPAGVVG